MSAEAVIARRRGERRRLIEQARRFVAGMDVDVDVRAAVVFGSVARGDFNERSDIDLLVIADGLPADPLARLPALGVELPPRLGVVAWTPREWRRQRERRNPVAVEAGQHGVWLVGSREELDR